MMDGSSEGERILIVEDDVLLARATQRALESHHVELAHDVASAKRLVREQEFDAVISDFELPDGNGAEVLACSLATHPDTPRILITSHADWETAARCLHEAEVFRVIAKPWTEEGLRGVVNAALELKHLRDERRELRATAERHQQETLDANARLEAVNHQLDRTLVIRTRQLIAAIVTAVDLRATGVGKRSRIIAALSTVFAKSLGMDAAAVEEIELAALLHDIGAIALPDCALNQEPTKHYQMPSADADRIRVPSIGYTLLKDIGFLNGAAQIVREHRERWDGLGYPQQLRREAITFGARLLAVVLRYYDVASATLLQARRDVLRDGYQFAHEAGCAAVIAAQGTQLDPSLAQRFLAQKPATWQRALEGA
ncbi:MAG: response regulator [Polyangiales bacterium]